MVICNAILTLFRIIINFQISRWSLSYLNVCLRRMKMSVLIQPLWSWWYGSWINNYLYLYKQCLSPLTLWVRIPHRRGVLYATLCDKVCQWLAAGRRFSHGTPDYSSSKTNRHDITEILWKVALNTISAGLRII
jgi:hypothetical protein